MTMRLLGVGANERLVFDDSVVVSWGELTSSKLQAQSYEEANLLSQPPPFGPSPLPEEEGKSSGLRPYICGAF